MAQDLTMLLVSVVIATMGGGVKIPKIVRISFMDGLFRRLPPLSFSSCPWWMAHRGGRGLPHKLSWWLLQSLKPLWIQALLDFVTIWFCDLLDFVTVLLIPIPKCLILYCCLIAYSEWSYWILWLSFMGFWLRIGIISLIHSLSVNWPKLGMRKFGWLSRLAN